MTEDAFVGTRVREFAEHINCDPEYQHRKREFVVINIWGAAI